MYLTYSTSSSWLGSPPSRLVSDKMVYICAAISFFADSWIASMRVSTILVPNVTVRTSPTFTAALAFAGRPLIVHAAFVAHFFGQCAALDQARDFQKFI